MTEINRGDCAEPVFENTTNFETFYKLEGIKARKKPIVIRVVPMNIAFTVWTKEGVLVGKPGDYLAEGVEGELYAIDGAIFKKTYEEVPE